MPPRNDFARDYVPVAERITEFYAKYPEGSLQSEVLTLTESLVLIKAWAYRYPDDPRPGIGHSSMTIPGSTSFTKGSETENAETSAWGRAIAALGFEVKNGVATAEDVRNKSGDSAPPRPVQQRQAPAPTPARSAAPGASTAGSGGMSVRDAMQALEGVDPKAISNKGKELFGTWALREMTGEQRAELVAALVGGGAPAPAPAPDDDGEMWGGIPTVPAA